VVLSATSASIRAISATINASFSGESREGKSRSHPYVDSHSPPRSQSVQAPRVNSPHLNPIWKVRVSSYKKRIKNSVMLILETQRYSVFVLEKKIKPD
jgi:hypothetical protein